jgi:hypothetical protein
MFVTPNVDSSINSSHPLHPGIRPYRRADGRKSATKTLGFTLCNTSSPSAGSPRLLEDFLASTPPRYDCGIPPLSKMSGLSEYVVIIAGVVLAGGYFFRDTLFGESKTTHRDPPVNTGAGDSRDFVSKMKTGVRTVLLSLPYF